MKLRSVVLVFSLLMMLGASLLAPASNSYAQAGTIGTIPLFQGGDTVIYKPRLVKISNAAADVEAANANKSETNCRDIWGLFHINLFLPQVRTGQQGPPQSCTDADISAYIGTVALKRNATQNGVIAVEIKNLNAQLLLGNSIPQTDLTYAVSTTIDSALMNNFLTASASDGKKFKLVGAFRIPSTMTNTVSAANSTQTVSTPQEELARAQKIEKFVKITQSDGDTVVYYNDYLHAGSGLRFDKQLTSSLCPAFPLAKGTFDGFIPEIQPQIGGGSIQQIWVKVKFTDEVKTACPALAFPYIWIPWHRFWQEIKVPVQGRVDKAIKDDMSLVPYQASASWIPEGGGQAIAEDILIVIIAIGGGFMMYGTPISGGVNSPGSFLFIMKTEKS